METINPRFERGQRVRAAQNLFNDGTYCEQLAHAMLVRRGEAGDIVRVAREAGSGRFVYLVEFALNQVIGCLEYELMPWCTSGSRNDGEDRVSGFVIQSASAQTGLRGCAIA